MNIRSDDYYVSKVRLWQTRTIAFFVIAILVVPIMHRLILGAMGYDVVTGKVTGISEESVVIEYDATYDYETEIRRSLELDKEDMPAVFFKGQPVVMFAPNTAWGSTDMNNASHSPYGMIASAICILLGFVSNAIYIKWRRLKKENLTQIESIRKNGEKISCKIEKVERTSKLARIHMITLTHTDRSGKTRTFLSDTLYFDPTNFFRGKEYLDVYVDRNDDERYVIDYPDDFPNNGAFHYF